MRTRRFRAAPLLAGLALLIVLAALAALAYLPPAEGDGDGGRELLVEIPHGTWAARMAAKAGESKAEILPDTLHLTLGVRNVLHLKNLDEVPQLFGPALMMPGQSFRLPFDVASTYSFDCTAHSSGQMRVIVAPAPKPGWELLRWRLTQGW